MAKQEEEGKERVCMSLPKELCNRLRTHYPYVSFSSLIEQLLEYADAAGFMMRLNDIKPEDYEPKATEPKMSKKAASRALSKAIETVVSPPEIEVFGA